MRQIQIPYIFPLSFLKSKTVFSQSYLASVQHFTSAHQAHNRSFQGGTLGPRPHLKFANLDMEETKGSLAYAYEYRKSFKNYGKEFKCCLSN